MFYCNCGCGEVVSREGLYYRGHWNKGRVPWNKGKTGVYSEETKKKWSEVRKGKLLSDNHKKKLLNRVPWNKGKTGVYSEETKKKMKRKEPMFFSKETRQKISESKKGKPSWNKGLTKETDSRLQKIADKKRGKSNNSLEYREESRQRMINGQALEMIKCIKKISNEEIKLRSMVKKIYPDCEFQFSILTYSVDVALVDKKIAIEYDGYYHFNCEGSKEYHKRRQEKIEQQGWKFLRYSIFDNFPTLEELKSAIGSLGEL